MAPPVTLGPQTERDGRIDTTRIAGVANHHAGTVARAASCAAAPAVGYASASSAASIVASNAYLSRFFQTTTPNGAGKRHQKRRPCPA